MHNEFWEIFRIIGGGLLGVSLAVFLKLQDITNANDNLNFWQTLSLFWRKCWASYFASIITVITYAVTHENWITLFTGDTNSHSIVSKIIGFVVLVGFLVGFLAQYGAYKYLLPKIDGILKGWGSTPNSTDNKPNLKP